MAILLWVSGVIAIFAGMLELGIAIWAVNVINGCFSYWQQHAAQKATDSLKRCCHHTLKFIVTVNPSRQRTAGTATFDTQVATGSRRCAMFTTSNLQVDESL